MSVPRVEHYHPPAEDISENERLDREMSHHLSKEDRFCSDTAIDILTRARARATQQSARYPAYLTMRKEKLADLTSLKNERQRHIDHYGPKANTKGMDAKIQRLEKSLADDKKIYEEYNAKHGAAMVPQMEDYVARQTRPLKDRGTTDKLLPGKSMLDMHTLCGENINRCRHELNGLQSAEVPLSDLERKVISDVKNMGGAAVTLTEAKRRRVKAGGKMQQGRTGWPTTNGRDVDAVAILFDLFREEITQKLLDRARKMHNPESAMTTAQLAEAITAAKAELLDWSYRSEFWRRKLAEQGTLVPAHTSDARALLDVVGPEPAES